MNKGSIRRQLFIVIGHMECSEGRRYRSLHSEYLGRRFPEKLHAIPQTPFIDELMPEMKKHAAQYLLRQARHHRYFLNVTLDVDTIATRISDADAIYYAAASCVAPDATHEEHKDWNPKYTRFKKRLRHHRGLSTYDAIRRHEKHNRLVSEQKKLSEYRGLSDSDHKYLADRRRLFGTLFGIVARHLKTPSTIMNQKVGDLIVLVLAESWKLAPYDDTRGSKLHEEALARQPRIAKLVTQISDWLREGD